jgi:hypothetical protein
MPTTTSQLQVTTQLEGDKITVTALILPNGFLPQNIFLYKNTGTNALGDYYGVANVEEMTRFQIFTGTAIPKFGNAFVRFNQAKITLSVNDDSASVIAAITQGVTNLSAAMKLAASTTKVITIS